MELNGGAVLVTGAARRIGAAIALRLARAGCGVAIHCHRSLGAAHETAARCAALGVRAEVLPADLTDAAAARGLIAEVRTKFGRLDALINNAAEFAPMTLDGFDLPAWERTLRVNLTAPLVLAHAARDLLAAARGRIVNLCDAATQRPWPDYLAYVVSKGALETLTAVLARAMAPEVNVVGIAPGLVHGRDDAAPAPPERWIERIPLGRAGTPEEVAAAVEFVLRDGDYLTGAILPLDGGRRLR